MSARAHAHSLIALTLLSILAPVTGSAADGRAVAACLECHRARAAGSGDVPVIEGQRAGYLAAQLAQFATRHRDSFPMSVIAAPLDAQSISKEMAAMPWPSRPRRDMPPRDRVRAAQDVRDGGCAGCHGETFTGVDAVPRLAGQDAAYLARQLDLFARGERIHVVQDSIRGWSRDERVRVARWLARLGVPVEKRGASDR